MYFAESFLPLSERTFGRKLAAEREGRDGEAKNGTLLSLRSGTASLASRDATGHEAGEWAVDVICHCSTESSVDRRADGSEALTTSFLHLIANVLRTQPLLLSSLLRGLNLLVTSTQTLVQSAATPDELRRQFGLDQSEARENLTYLESLAKDLVAVLLNVFSSMPRGERGMVGEVIGAWVGIMSENVSSYINDTQRESHLPKDTIETYQSIVSHLSTALAAPAPQAPSPGASPITHTMLDLLNIFVPYLPPGQSTELLSSTASPLMLEHKDAAVQKKSYKLLGRLWKRRKSISVLTASKNLSRNSVLWSARSEPGAQRVSRGPCLVIHQLTASRTDCSF